MSELVIPEGACCPRCRSELRISAMAGRDLLVCTDPSCVYARDGFPVVRGQPVLIDFDASIFDRASFLRSAGESIIPRDETKRSFRQRARRVLYGRNRVAIDNARILLAELRRSGGRRVLVVGGGELGDGIADISREPDVEVVGTDVYLSRFTQLAADGHRLPFKDGSFDGVWVQAVLEHVLEPWVVASEIGRVLKDGGLVYADTPFMQQVHEGAYDFTRFSVSGHRWLFRGFDEIGSGAVGGAGTALLWSLRYFVRSLVGSDKAATVATVPFFWLRFFDRLTRGRPNEDAASGVFFLGMKSRDQVRPKDMVAFYETREARRRSVAADPAARSA